MAGPAAQREGAGGKKKVGPFEEVAIIFITDSWPSGQIEQEWEHSAWAPHQQKIDKDVIEHSSTWIRMNINPASFFILWFLKTRFH